jgi:hypothetical protein
VIRASRNLFVDTKSLSLLLVLVPVEHLRDFRASRNRFGHKIINNSYFHIFIPIYKHLYIFCFLITRHFRSILFRSNIVLLAPFLFYSSCFSSPHYFELDQITPLFTSPQDTFYLSKLYEDVKLQQNLVHLF